MTTCLDSVLCRENIENDLYLCKRRMRSIYRERAQFRLHAHISRNFLEQENAGFCIKRRPGPDEDREALRSNMRAEAAAFLRVGEKWKCQLGHGDDSSESVGTEGGTSG